jgi:hypothetical protein
MKQKINFLICLGFLLFFLSNYANCAVYDPLGNKIFEGSGESLYTIDATYGLIDGDSVTNRAKKFREILSGATYIGFPIGSRKINSSHQRWQFLDSFLIAYAKPKAIRCNWMEPVFSRLKRQNFNVYIKTYKLKPFQ